MRLIIAGGRDFTDYDLLSAEVHKFLIANDEYYDRTTIISGGCRGADELGERLAKEWACDIEVYKANWALNGSRAGPIRNKLMASKADACIVFWNGKSFGTKSMITEAKMKNLLLKVVNY